MRRNLLIFAVCIVVLLGAYRWGQVRWETASITAMEQLYDGIIGILFPTIGMYDATAGELAYEDINGMFLPVLSAMGQNSVGTNSGVVLPNPPLGSDDREEGRTEDALTENSQMQSSQSENSQNQNSQNENSVPQTPSENEPTESEQPAQTVPVNGLEVLAKLEKKVEINRQKLQDFDYLRQNFYQVDNATTIGSDLLNASVLLKKEVALKTDVDGPQILIYHTHSQEAYRDSAPGDKSTSIVAVGEYLAELLSQQYGIEVLHHKGEYDVQDHAKAYSAARPAIQKILKEHPSIEVVIDLHRDGVQGDTHLVTQINGKPTAKIMFFNGLSRLSDRGELTYLKNPYIEENLAISLQLQLAAEEYFPGLTRRIYLKGYRYNMHLCPKSLLIEVGAQTNSFEEAKNAMEPLAILLAKVLKTDKVP